MALDRSTFNDENIFSMTSLECVLDVHNDDTFALKTSCSKESYHDPE